MIDTGAERRNYARERTHIEVEIQREFLRTKGVMEYVSFGGALVSLSRTFPPQSVIQIRFEVPGHFGKFEGNARVVWTQKNKAIGIEFLELPPAERLKLESLLTH